MSRRKHQIESLFGLWHREHDAQMLSVYLGITEVLTMPGDIYLLKKLV